MKKKTITVAILILALIAVFVGTALLLSGRKKLVVDDTVSHTVTVADCTATSESAVFRFDLERSGNYSFHVEWTTEPAGLITGLSVTDLQGNTVFACGAESLTADSAVMRLEKGTYTATFRAITSPESMLRFLAETGAVPQESSPDADYEDEMWEYRYLDNGSWEMEYLLQLKTSPNFFLQAGIICGVVIGLILVVLLLAVTKTDGTIHCKYDERQEAIRGKAYKYAFFTMLGSTFFMMLWKIMEFPNFAEYEVLLFLNLVLGIFVYAAYSIWNEAYFALNENKNRLLISFFVIALVNLLISVNNISHGNILTDGKLNFYSLNLFCAFLCLMIFVVILAKKLKDRKEENA